MPETAKAQTYRRRVRLSFVLAICFAAIWGSVWFSVKLQLANVRSQAIAEIRRSGGWVFYDCEYGPAGRLKTCGPRHPKWLQRWLGVDFLGRVHGVKLTDAGHLEGLGDLQAISRPCPDVTDWQLALLETLTDLQWLALHDAPIGDAGLAHLEGLKNLERLWLDNSRITDAGLPSLACSSNLRTLSLCGTAVSDDGLRHLAGLTGLERLLLGGTRISDTGLARLAGLTRLEQLQFDHTRCTFSGAVRLLVERQGRDLSEAVRVAGWATMDEAGNVVSLDLSNIQVTDSGLARLAGLSALRWLYLNGSDVTDAGLSHLEGISGLTLLDLTDTQVTDAGLENLSHLGALRTLHLSGTRVTDAGLDELETTLGPDLRIYRRLCRPVRMRSAQHE